MRRISLGVCLGVVIGLTLSNVLRPVAVQGDDKKAAENQVFEMRTYIAPEGKLKDLHSRFRDHTCKLFEKHGMKNVIYLSPTEPKAAENTLVYIISHASKAAADKSWAAFRADPEWQAAAKKSEENGKLVMSVKAEFFTATDYSPVK